MMAMKPLILSKKCFPTECFLVNDLVSDLRKSLLLCSASGQTSFGGGTDLLKKASYLH